MKWKSPRSCLAPRMIFASCLNVWHCSNSKLLPRCKSIHLGWQEDLTHQQLVGRTSYTLSGKHISILGYPQTQDNTSPGLLWLTKSMSFAESPLALDCFLLRPPPGGNSHSPLYKNTHSYWQGPDRTVVKAAPGPISSVTGLRIVGLTNQLAGPRFLEINLLERKQNDRHGAAENK